MSSKKNPNANSQGNNRTLIIVAIIGTIGVIAAAIISRFPLNINSNPVELNISVHVTDQNGGKSIQGAKAMLFLEGSPFVEFTDSNGISTFGVTAPKNSRARLFVETDQFEIYDSNIQLKENQDIKIQLTPKGSNDKKIIVRVVDDGNSMPIEEANVVLIESGNTYSETTDSNGLAKFIIAFANNQIEADITVNTSEYSATRLKVTLKPDQIQDIRLNPEISELVVTTFEASTSGSTGGTDSIAFGQIVTGAISVPAQIDKYTFSGTINDTILISLVKTSGDFWPQIRLLGPDGSELKSAKTGGGKVELSETLPETGKYSIIIDDGFQGVGTGDYSLIIQRLSP